MSETPQENSNRPQNAVVLSNNPQPLPARNLQDMLRYTTEVTANAGDSQTQNHTPLDEESKRFLREALASMTTDVIAQLKTGIENIEALLKADYFSEEDCDAAFEHVLELVDKIDFANDFYKIGGFRVFTPCLSSSVSLMRWRCCELIAELCQHNPFCQDKVFSEGYLAKLISLLTSDPDEVVRIKALYGISCAVRENERMVKEFLKLDGLSVLLSALETNNDKLKIKAAFLLSSLCSQSLEIKELILRTGFVEKHVKIINERKNVPSIVEHLLSALQALVVDFPEAQKFCRQADLNLKPILKSIIENNEKQEEAKEIVEYSKQILKSVFGQD